MPAIACTVTLHKQFVRIGSSSEEAGKKPRKHVTGSGCSHIFGRLDGAAELVVDERLRENEFGILDRLTRWGIEEFHPEQAEIRRAFGKFYHRPPGGESWCDVILRLRSALHTLSIHYATCRVLVVGHQVVVLCFRYLLENLDEAALLAVDERVA